ncbi:2,3-bisphosphoglycerate-independent phosphoglycerate mutase [Candidatus Dojkabacteria bacterium]|uniref:2,3-bisphosphoglycerate-independent phosphoglycerate mutase n=1 Tax=Candidatus Dojkabacteria bacterium TaxID=2099670 RepID=A0A3M0YZM5_9BACT|nr:MAG: 2,3-bisphosphoglycerate-independent phosphoglycerate mutase [Candidatus Dojkabacteria bacterium]
MANFINRPKPVVLISMDGVGVAAPSEGNAVTLAKTPNLDLYWPRYPHTYLEASGLHVGLPSGIDGNSEVGHMTMGAGKVIFQNLPRIDNAIRNKSFFYNSNLKKAFEHAKSNRSSVHIMGIAGNGLVHGSIDHLFAILKFAIQEKVNPDKVFVHVFTDGRDSSPNSARDVIEEIEYFLFQKRIGRIASIVGRAYAMDRNRNWSRTQVAYDMLTKGKGKLVKNWRKAIEDSYARDVFDEYLEPMLIVDVSEQPNIIKDNDTVIFYNFRPDRAVQLTMAFEDENFKGFERISLQNLFFIGMVDYEHGFPKNVIFPPEKVLAPLGKVLSDEGLKQLRVAESEKFPHVTYFFNGQNKNIFPGETWLEVPSPREVPTYDLKPEMSQKWVAEVVIDKISEDKYDFILVNFAGPDMVAHTGNIDATIKSVEACDWSVGKIVDYVLKKGGAVFVTADHGNAEEMIDLQTGEIDTKHSTNPVPFLAIKKDWSSRELPIGGLADVATTILAVMGIKPPPEMTGRNLLA